MTPALYFIKALHIIFAVTWFAALFYLPRLFIYQTEAKDKEDVSSGLMIDQFKLMANRLWKAIGWPSLILNIVFGVGILNPYFKIMPLWLIIKLVLVVLLVGYHVWLHAIFKQLQNNVYKYKSDQLRWINEIATVFLFGIVILGVMKAMINFTYFTIGMIFLMLLLYMGIVLYRRRRKREIK